MVGFIEVVCFYEHFCDYFLIGEREKSRERKTCEGTVSEGSRRETGLKELKIYTFCLRMANITECQRNGQDEHGGHTW